MMRQMRENTKWIMLITAVAFVALMVFEWGMDITGQTSGSFGELGRVNGDPVTYDMYQAAYRNLYDQVSQAQDEPITSAQNREIEDAAWNEVVNQVLIQQELARRGIRVSDQEIMDAARFSPPPELMEDPLFQTDGQFDVQRYQDFLANAADPLFLLQLEAYYREVIPQSKLMRQITAGIYFTDAELWEAYREADEQVRLRFLALNPSLRIPDEEVEVTDREIQSYYREHEEDFQVPAQAQVRYVALTKAPLQEDTAAARTRAQEIRQEILEGADFAEVARRESADEASSARGGDLGTVGRGQMAPAFDSVAFSIPVNQISEPVKTASGFHIIQVQSRQSDSVQARHILVPVERTNESELRLLTLADTLEVLGELRTLDEAASEIGFPVQTQQITELFPFLPGVGQISDGLLWVFEEGSPGEVSPVFEDRTAFYMMELVSSTPEGTQSLEEARPNIERILRVEKKVAMAREEAREMAQRAREAGTLEVLEDGDRLQVEEAGPGTRNDFFQGLGVQNKAVGAAFGLDEGEISDPVSWNNNVYLVQTLERIPADSAAFQEELETQRARLSFQVQQQRLQQWVQGLREAADIVDRREQVFQTNQADRAPQPGGLF
ncbi:MAG: SurA N-terminal domain-containing protein [Gemmatimonadota bacterium]